MARKLQRPKRIGGWTSLTQYPGQEFVLFDFGFLRHVNGFTGVGTRQWFEGVERGTGLGLAIVKAVATAHGGVAELMPAVNGEGATFRVVVPLATPLPHEVPRLSSGDSH